MAGCDCEEKLGGGDVKMSKLSRKEKEQIGVVMNSVMKYIYMIYWYLV